MLVLYNNGLQSLFRSQILTLGAVFLAILVMFWLLFRSLSLALIALAPNMLAAGLVLGVMGLVGIPLDIMTITIAAIVVGIGVDDCIHYVHRYLREFPTDRDYRATMYRCHGSIGRAMYYTTVTVVIGFSTLQSQHLFRITDGIGDDCGGPGGIVAPASVDCCPASARSRRQRRCCVVAAAGPAVSRRRSIGRFSACPRASPPVYVVCISTRRGPVGCLTIPGVPPPALHSLPRTRCVVAALLKRLLFWNGLSKPADLQ